MAKYPVSSVEAVPRGSLLRVEVAGRDVCLAHAEDGQFYALDDPCTHEQAPLSEGDLLGGEIQCPLHNSRFDLATGAVRGLPATEPTNVYVADVGDDGVVYVEVDD